MSDDVAILRLLILHDFLLAVTPLTFEDPSSPYGSGSSYIYPQRLVIPYANRDVPKSIYLHRAENSLLRLHRRYGLCSYPCKRDIAVPCYTGSPAELSHRLIGWAQTRVVNAPAENNLSGTKARLLASLRLG